MNLDRELCKQIQPYMKGIETLLCHRATGQYKNPKAGTLIPVTDLIFTPEHITLGITPAYSFLDMLGVLPSQIMHNDILYSWINSPNAIHYEKVEDLSILKDSYNSYDEIPELPEALAKLIIWCAENGYIKEVG